MKNLFIYRQIYSRLFPRIAAIAFMFLILGSPPGSDLIQAEIVRLDGSEYAISDAAVSVGWDPVSNAAAYEARLTLFMKDPITYFAIATIPGTENSITFTRPRAGHFRVEVRACRFADCRVTNPTPGVDVSRWAESTNIGDAQVDGVPRAWWIYWKVPKPIIE